MLETPIVVSAIGVVSTAIGVVATVLIARWKNRSDAKIAEAAQQASPYEALATRVVTLEASDQAKHQQIVSLSSQVMTIEATSESRRLLLGRAADRHAGVVAHVDRVEVWIGEQAPGATPPQLDPELRLPIVVQ